MNAFDDYRLRIETALASAIEELGEPSPLRDACAYACQSGGKRLRPLLVLLIAEALPLQRAIMPAALSVEYFHTASLIADDLPCMDNDDYRRSKPSLHKVYEESVAILASYTLIAAGYGGLYETGRRLKAQEPHQAAAIDAALSLSLEAVSRCAGLRGATHGQFLDLFPPDASYETLRTIIDRKTVTLFEISFLLGWLFGGGDMVQIDEVKRAASHLGVAFQIADDLQDLLQDSKPGSVNLAHFLGAPQAQALFQEELVGLERSLKRLGLWTPPFQNILQSLEESIGAPR